MVSPMTMYLGNPDQYGDFTPLLVTFISVFLLATSALLAFVWASQTHAPLRQSVSGLIVGVALAAWVQSQILIWDFGPLDGRGLPWENFTRHVLAETAIWILVIASSLIIFLKKPRIAPLLITAAWLLGAISLIANITVSATAGNLKLTRETSSYPTREEALAFHPRNNVVLVVLDSFQSDAFLEIWQKYPEEVAFLRGFTFYPNSVGGYPTTRHSLPLILTGKFYRNDFPYIDANRGDFENPNLLSYYAAKNYGAIGDVGRPIFTSFAPGQIFPPSLRDQRLLGISIEWINAVDIGLFRATPIPIKKRIYDENRWFLTKIVADSAPPPPHGEDWRFIKNFREHAAVSSRRNGEFKFIHLLTPHYPLSVDASFTYSPGLANTRENYVNQARGALLLARKLLGKLEELRVYDTAEIMIISDHGTDRWVPIDQQFGDHGLDIPVSHIGSGRPLFLHKPSEATGSLRQSSEPMHLSYVPCILGDPKAFDCENYLASRKAKNVPRQHFRYTWAHDFWYKNFSPPMTLYEVRGDARIGESWANSEIVYTEGSSHQLDRSYKLGDLVDFGQSGPSEKYIVSGWSVQEAEHRWTEGEVAKLAMMLDEPPGRSIRLELDALGFSPDGSRPQSVAVLINGREVAVWEVLERRRYQAEIPSEVIPGNRISITFKIGEPRSPYDANKGADRRRIGLAAFGLTLNSLP